MRPPEPRRESARYIAYLRSVQTLFTQLALSAAADGTLTRAELEQAWASATQGAKRFLESVSANVARDDAQYWRKLAKGRAVPQALQARAARETWVEYNLELIADIGAKQIGELLSARTDAAHPKGFTSGRNTRLDTPCVNCGQRRGTHSDPGLICPDGSGRKYRKPSADGKAVAEPQLPPVDAARARNVNLISGQTEAQRAQLTSMFKAAQAKGQRHETLVERVQAITGAGEKRAKLIARDQTVKHNAVIRQETARSLGIAQFIWRTSGDEAVRPYHKRLNGKTFSYADPPVTDAYGHRNLPGEDYNCRCTDEPVVDLFAGLDGPDLSGSLKAQGKLKPKAPPRERAARATPAAPKLGPRARPLLAGVNEQDLNFLRSGYRDPIFPYSGAAPEQVNAIATGELAPIGSRNALPPITISIYPGNATPVLTDGRHRLEAAQAAGAARMRARIVEYDKELNIVRENTVNIPVPKPDAEKLKRLLVRPKKP